MCQNMLFVKSSPSLTDGSGSGRGLSPFYWKMKWVAINRLCFQKPQLSCLPTYLSPNLSPFMIKIYLQTIAAMDRWGRIRGVVIGKQVKILIQCWNFESLLSRAVFKHLSCPPDLQNRRHGLVGEDSRLLVGGRMGGMAGILLLSYTFSFKCFSQYLNI